jgi:hypothetical protein
MNRVFIVENKDREVFSWHLAIFKCFPSSAIQTASDNQFKKAGRFNLFSGHSVIACFVNVSIVCSHFQLRACSGYGSDWTFDSPPGSHPIIGE